MVVARDIWNSMRESPMWSLGNLQNVWLEECARQRREVAVGTQFRVPAALLSSDSDWKAGRNKTVPLDDKKSEVESMGARVMPRKVWNASEAQPDTGADFAAFQDKDSSRQPLKTLLPNRASHHRNGLHDSKSASSQVSKIQTPGFSKPVKGRGQLPQLPLKRILTSGEGCERSRCEPFAIPPTSHVNSEGKERVFQGRVFDFAPSFEAPMRAEVVQWMLEGGGVLLGEVGTCDALEAEFMICPHGLKKNPSVKSNVKSVSAQWIKYCLQEGTLLDINSHILFRPLSCEVPLPGFQTLRFVSTQYADGERILLYNLCHVLGAKYQEMKMTRRATHLLCKVGDGQKYESALQWGVEVVTPEWLYACVAHNMVVAPDPHRPKKLTVAEKEAGLAIPTQHPLQLASHDAGFPVMERCLAKSSADIPLSTKENESGKVEMKGKTGNIKKNTSLRGRLQALQTNTPSTTCSLTPQNGGNLDPWDELTASWTNDDATRRPATRSQQNAISSLRGLSSVPVDLGLPETQHELHDDLNEVDRPTDGSQGTESHQHVSSELDNSSDALAFENEEHESGRDVAAAIEGLLAQTRKVQREDASKSPERDRDPLSHDMVKLGRRNGAEILERASFKRPKQLSNRSIDCSGEEPMQSGPTAEDSYENLEESQMDSQVVAYDEDHSEKQKIMERVRTRSLSTPSGPGVNVERKEPPWKAVGLNRLLKAADANK